MKLLLATISALFIVLFGVVMLHKLINNLSWKESLKKIFEYFFDLF